MSGWRMNSSTTTPSSNNTTRASSGADQSPEEAIWKVSITCLILTLITFSTVFGNILVILSVFTYRPLRSVQNFLLVSLAVSDLSVAILVMPFNIVNYALREWRFGQVLCDMWLTSDIFFCTASILNLCGIALDRYWAIRCPITYANRRTLNLVLLMIFLVYALSALISIPPLFGWKKASASPTVCQLTDEKGYVIFSASGSFFIPAIIMCGVYLNIFFAVQRRLKQRKQRSALTKVQQYKTTATPAAAPTDAESLNNNAEETLQSTEGKKKKPGRRKKKKKKKVTAGGQDESSSVEENNTAGAAGGGGDNRGGATGAHSPSTTKNQMSISPTPGKPIGASAATGTSAIQQQQQNFVQERQKISLSRERRAARTLGIIMGTFVLSWLPFFLMYIIMPFCGRACHQHLDKHLENFIVWLGYLNSALNPVIYTIFNMDFRRAFQKLLRIK